MQQLSGKPASARSRGRRHPPNWRRWTLACVAGETLGIAAAAGAAGVLAVTVGEPVDWPTALAVWFGSIAGGAVEGVAVASLQMWALRPWLPGLSARRWVGTTTAVAMVCWALGMAAPALVTWRIAGDPVADATPTTGPPLALMPLVGLALGLVLGVVFGAAQAWALRGQVSRPRRWVVANACGWAAAMAVIMTGASIPSGPWPWPQLLALGAVTGVLAGLTIGAVTGLFLPFLDDDSPSGLRRGDWFVLWVLRNPRGRDRAAEALS